MILFYKVNKIIYKRYFIKQIFRHVHTQNSRILYPLESKKLLKINGNDAPVFLQGLITNDMRHFEEGARSMYAMFLNNKGRVLYDTLIHKWVNDAFMIECDKNVHSMLQRHLKLYKLKRLVDIEDVSDQFRIWALISPIEKIDTQIEYKSKIDIYKDPRLSDLGYRVVSSKSINETQIVDILGNDVKIDYDENGYKYLRYSLGVSEGAKDLPPGMCFPLEVNCDYLHGVSFHKGCYIGQELTARVYHTGVIRKRIMPLKFNNKINDSLEQDTVITLSGQTKSNIGKLKSYIWDYGLGLVRIKEALDVKVVRVGKHTAEIIKPVWWPLEAPKEKVVLTKTE
ncbi:putative transferase CAF17 homolog, mitochondrial [Achroia grisella]|uniref:putative transferase CAF17 homolog, mitochondrial n=1 Tax=Achroia grisella TaxID=688607 RepID=UPI0027D2C371|nr:putative transferase CAF17 homolog, mitochondrial [Achroia grisella]XP_059053368.1 putative transferase CAF17 homolog, mitochondrial [Achroia grisella]